MSNWVSWAAGVSWEKAVGSAEGFQVPLGSVPMKHQKPLETCLFILVWDEYSVILMEDLDWIGLDLYPVNWVSLRSILLAYD